jgi:hypothetical protein
VRKRVLIAVALSQLWLAPSLVQASPVKADDEVKAYEYEGRDTGVLTSVLGVLDGDRARNSIGLRLHELDQTKIDFVTMGVNAHFIPFLHFDNGWHLGEQFAANENGGGGGWDSGPLVNGTTGANGPTNSALSGNLVSTMLTTLAANENGASQVPEPATAVLFGSALLAGLLFKRKA